MTTTQLNQIIAIEKSVKSAAAKDLTAAYQRLEKRDQYIGQARTYLPLDEENGEKLPAENKKVQTSVDETIKSLRAPLERLMDVVSAKEVTNTTAKADVVVNGTVLIKDAPVTFLLFLEKQLVDLHTFVGKLPTLSPDQDWAVDVQTGLFKTEPRETHRTKKVTEHKVIVQATDKFPAQTAQVTEDVIAGYWRTVNFSGETTPVKVREMLAKIEDLQRAVKFAREAANSVPVIDKPVGTQVLGFIFGA